MSCRKKIRGIHDCTGTEFPEDISISDFSEVYLFFDYDFQNKPLELEKYVLPHNEVAILNAFLLFLYEYFK